MAAVHAHAMRSRDAGPMADVARNATGSRRSSSSRDPADESRGLTARARQPRTPAQDSHAVPHFRTQSDCLVGTYQADQAQVSADRVAQDATPAWRIGGSQTDWQHTATNWQLSADDGTHAERGAPLPRMRVPANAGELIRADPHWFDLTPAGQAQPIASTHASSTGMRMPAPQQWDDECDALEQCDADNSGRLIRTNEVTGERSWRFLGAFLPVWFDCGKW